MSSSNENEIELNDVTQEIHEQQLLSGLTIRKDRMNSK
jgi:hypothetical protein